MVLDTSSWTHLFRTLILFIRYVCCHQIIYFVVITHLFLYHWFCIFFSVGCRVLLACRIDLPVGCIKIVPFHFTRMKTKFLVHILRADASNIPFCFGGAKGKITCSAFNIGSSSASTDRFSLYNFFCTVSVSSLRAQFSLLSVLLYSHSIFISLYRSGPSVELNSIALCGY